MFGHTIAGDSIAVAPICDGYNPLLPKLGEKLGKVVLPRIIPRAILTPSKPPKSQFHLQDMEASHST